MDRHRPLRPVWNRQGFSLVELLVCIAILGVLIALLLPAIQKVRARAIQTQSSNKIRQLCLGLHSYAAARGGLLPGVPLPLPRKSGPDDHAPYGAIQPYIEYRTDLFVSPADPSVTPELKEDPETCSYVYNCIVFQSRPKLPGSFPDGSANTIAIAEKYARCGSGFASENSATTWTTSFGAPYRRPSFAEVTYGDVVPITTGTPPRTNGSVSGKTFQLAPRLDDCDRTIPQTPHSGGMLIALFDGSVRTISGSVAPELFWGLVTPTGSEVVSDDW